jgi:hypothetical protein
MVYTASWKSKRWGKDTGFGAEILDPRQQHHPYRGDVTSIRVPLIFPGKPSKILKSDYGDGLVRVEAIVHLVLIVAVYLLFWRLHGPRIEKNRLTNIRNFVFRKWRKG